MNDSTEEPKFPTSVPTRRNRRKPYRNDSIIFPELEQTPTTTVVGTRIVSITMDIDDEMNFEEIDDDMLKISNDPWDETTMSFDDDYDEVSDSHAMDEDEQEATKLALYTLIFDQFLDSDSDDDTDDSGDTDLIATIIKFANSDDTTGQEAIMTDAMTGQILQHQPDE
jgi:hypothetical protein